MKLLVSMFTALLLAAPLTSHALSGNELNDYCQSKSGFDLCSGIVSGSVQGFKLAQESSKAPYFLCIPNGVTNGQLVDIVKNYLSVRPSERHGSGYTLVILAVREAYPCK